MIHSWLHRVLLLLTLVPAMASPGLRLPHGVSCVPESTPHRLSRHDSGQSTSLQAYPRSAPEESWVFTDRVVLKLVSGVLPQSLLQGRPLAVERQVMPGLFLLQAPDAATAWLESESLSGRDGVLEVYPIHQAPKEPLDGYAPAPRDELFGLWLDLPSCVIDGGIQIPPQRLPGQWYLENRNPLTGQSVGVDINIRPAWSITRGKGVTVAVVDTGIELSHPDLQSALAPDLHFNFKTGQVDGIPILREEFGAHGTSAAGLIAATANNSLGMSGVAPDASLAAWVIYDSMGRSITTERMGEMFSHAMDDIAVQNHSWGPVGSHQRGPDSLEDAGMARAWVQGRGGLGTVMVFAAGNRRAQGGWANDNGFASDPRVIGVAGVSPLGRATAASVPGSSMLLAVPTGDDASGGLMTTDLLGIEGANFISFCPPYEYLSGFRWGGLGFKHTSAAAPLVSGVAALVLSVNPQLTARDVHQVLLLSSSHVDLADPDLHTNGVGLKVSHNVGYGILDAGEAVRLAQHWTNRPPIHHRIRPAEDVFPLPIPDGGYRIEVSGINVPVSLSSVAGIPGFGIQPDRPKTPMPLKHLGLATQVPSQRLDGHGALIERGEVGYDVKVANAASAGAAFAIVYNQEIAESETCPGGDQLCFPSSTDYSPIPVIFIGRTAGLELKSLIESQPSTLVRIALNSVSTTFRIDETWQCERVGVRVRSDFTMRGDLRITLTSPSGTTSILQRYNGDVSPGPVDWTYWSTHHYFEPTAGVWTLSVTDEAPGEGTGNLLGASLLLDGVPIQDSDRDGLDDSWEWAHLGTLSHGPAEDPDEDGYSNIREYLEGSDPQVDERSHMADIGFFSDALIRLSWPGRSGEQFQIQSGNDLNSLSSSKIVPGRFPVSSTIIPAPSVDRGFFSVEKVPVPAP